MEIPSVPKYYELICVVVNFGSAEKVIKIAKQIGITGATVFLGRGTAHNYWLQLLDLADVRKELILIAAEENQAHQALEALNNKIDFAKPKHGIAFSLPVAGLLGMHGCPCLNPEEGRGVNNTMHKAIFVVVDKGNAETVVDTATAAGARGATIINARGSGIHENQMLFAMAIEPEKELVMIIAKEEITEAVVNAIRNHHKIDDPGNGILFMLDVNQTYGLR
ncbi:MAG TPA: P-II family nitrogen regulator [Bacillota bacterium]|nr:P-II family nitrogen regulator [Bacillota bacterium]